MSLLGMLRTTCTIQRRDVQKGTAGGQTMAWGDVVTEAIGYTTRELAEQAAARRVALLLLGLAVLRAVEFDGQHCLVAKEIEHALAEGMLAAKFVAAQTPVAQPAPHQLLRPRREGAQILRAVFVRDLPADIGADRARKAADETERSYLHRGIAQRAFELRLVLGKRTFGLLDLELDLAPIRFITVTAESL